MALRTRDLSSRVQVWRSVESQNERAETVRTYAPAGAAWIALPDARRTFRDAGAGEAPAGSAQARANRYAQIEATDVLEVIAGDHLGTTWRVGPLERVADELRFPLEAYTDPLPRE